MPGKCHFKKAKQQRRLQKQRNSRSYIKMIFISTISYIFCTICASILIIWGMNQNEEKFDLSVAFAYDFVFFNSSFTFLFYCMSGSAYREAFRKAVKIKARCGNRTPANVPRANPNDNQTFRNPVATTRF